MKKKRYLALIIAIIMFSMLFQNSITTSAAAADSSDTLKKVADNLYTRYRLETKALDKTIIKSSSKTIESNLSKAEKQLLAFCTGMATQKYSDRMRLVFKVQEFEPTYAVTDTLKESRIISLDENSAVVWQYRKIKTEDTEWGGKGRTFYSVKYVFLEKSTVWKLQDIADSKAFPMAKDEAMAKTYYADVTGDSVKDNIYLVEKKETPESIYAFTVRVLVNGKSYKLDPAYYGGYFPAAAFSDLNGDGVNDIFVSMGTGGSSGASLYYAFTLKSGKFKELLGKKQGTESAVTLDMKFLDNYKVEIRNTGYKINRVIDISSGSKNYEDGGMYVNGKLKDPKVVPAIDLYVSLIPQDIDFDGQFELVGMQMGWGFWHANMLFEFITILKYEKSKWVLKDYQILNTTMDSTEDDLKKAEEVAALWGNYVVKREDKKATGLMTLGNSVTTISNPHPVAFKLLKSRLEGGIAFVDCVLDSGYTAQPYFEKEFLELKMIKDDTGFIINARTVTNAATAIEKQPTGDINININSKPSVTIKKTSLPTDLKGRLSAMALDDSLTKLAISSQDGDDAYLTIYDIATKSFTPVEKMSGKIIANIYFDKVGNLVI